LKIIDGKATAEAIKAELKHEVDQWVADGHRAPHLAAILVGENPASQSYVRNKIKFCEEVGYQSTLLQFSADITEEALLLEVERLNQDATIDGYIVQLPLPKHINEEKINLAIDPRKDVDGFHPLNFGRMALGLPTYLPATPGGILELFKRYNIDTAGKKCVVLGRSNIVGNPMAILMAQKNSPGNSTVTILHSRSQNLEEEIRAADILIAAIGIPHFVKADWLKRGVVVIDVGINRIQGEDGKFRLVGDVDFDQAKELCSLITPVPGGVGPMTVTCLMMNTLKAAKKLIYPAN